LEDREKKPNTDATPRAFLLPILASLRSHPTPLAHFTQTFLPLIDQLINLATGPRSNPGIAKVWSVLAYRCWNTLPAYCSNPPDLSDAFGRELGERLTKEMYANTPPTDLTRFEERRRVPNTSPKPGGGKRERKRREQEEL